MTTISLFRVIKMGFVNFWRNFWLSAAATLVMVITLIILSILLLMFVLTNYSVQSIRERVDISAYFKIGLAEEQIQTVKKDLEANPRIREVSFVSAEQALADFKNNHIADPLILESLGELNENPLPATLQIKAHTLEEYPAIAEELQSEKYATAIDKVNFEDNRLIIEKLNRILKIIVTGGIGLVAIFSIIAILVIFNTITLTIYNRREEVEIMRLVGATNWYIRGPFLTEALMYSVVASIITGALLIPVYANLMPQLNNYLNPGSQVFAESFINFPSLLAVQFGVALVLSIFSTMLAIRKYLKI
jgi:cell division transport system permease protein